MNGGSVNAKICVFCIECDDGDNIFIKLEQKCGNK
jgi:hypothetical protein